MGILFCQGLGFIVISSSEGQTKFDGISASKYTLRDAQGERYLSQAVRGDLVEP